MIRVTLIKHQSSKGGDKGIYLFPGCGPNDWIHGDGMLMITAQMVEPQKATGPDGKEVVVDRIALAAFNLSNVESLVIVKDPDLEPKKIIPATEADAAAIKRGLVGVPS